MVHISTLYYLFGALTLEKEPEILVTGAELNCPCATENSHLIVMRNNMDLNNLQEAIVTDREKGVNILHFEGCTMGTCEFHMDLEEEWQNLTPQDKTINEKEVITTESIIICKRSGMAIEAVNSGQDGVFAEMLKLMLEMDDKYPGLRALLDDPYASLFLTEGMLALALEFLSDIMGQRDNSISLLMLDSNNVEDYYILAVFSKLVNHDINNFKTTLEDMIERVDLRNGVVPEYLDENMMAVLKADCAWYEEQLKNDPVIRSQEQNKMFYSFAAQTVSSVAAATTVYASMLNWANANSKVEYDKDLRDAEIADAHNEGTVEVPDKAKEMANIIKNNNGTPPKGYKGGRVYRNEPVVSGHLLPEGVNYREYDVNPYVKGQGRGTERLVIGDDGSVFYTNDHYYRFTKVG